MRHKRLRDESGTGCPGALSGEGDALYFIETTFLALAFPRDRRQGLLKFLGMGPKKSYNPILSTLEEKKGKFTFIHIDSSQLGKLS